MAVADPTEVERKYALIKLDKGDWLLPSNDAKTIWRLTKYEDGPSHGITDWDRDKTFWAVWRWIGTGHPSTLEDVEDWSLWSHEVSSLDSRKEAIREAMRLA